MRSGLTGGEDKASASHFTDVLPALIRALRTAAEEVDITGRKAFIPCG